MRKLILKMSVTIDGFVGGPNGESDWIFRTEDPEADKWTMKILRQAGAHMMGSKTFRDMKSYWPKSKEPFAAVMNDIPKIVFSKKGISKKDKKVSQSVKDARRYNNVGWKKVSPDSNWDDSLVLTGDLATEIRKLKKQSGKIMVAHGGASFAQSLIATGLIDEFDLLVHPVALGEGLPIFSKLPKELRLQLVMSKKYKSGVVAQVYKPIKGYKV